MGYLLVNITPRKVHSLTLALTRTLAHSQCLHSSNCSLYYNAAQWASRYCRSSHRSARDFATAEAELDVHQSCTLVTGQRIWPDTKNLPCSAEAVSGTAEG